MKKIFAIISVIIITCSLCSCSSWNRGINDIKSDFGGGLNRTVTVYTADGKVIAKYKGKIDIEPGSTYVKFDFKGKRYIYYNCFVETIADLSA